MECFLMNMLRRLYTIIDGIYSSNFSLDNN